MDVFLTVIRVILQILTYSIFIRAILSWIMPGQTNILTDILFHITEPIMAPLRKIIPQTSTIDFTPVVAIIILQIILYFI